MLLRAIPCMKWQNRTEPNNNNKKVCLDFITVKYCFSAVALSSQTVRMLTIYMNIIVYKLWQLSECFGIGAYKLKNITNSKLTDRIATIELFISKFSCCEECFFFRSSSSTFTLYYYLLLANSKDQKVKLIIERKIKEWFFFFSFLFNIPKIETKNKSYIVTSLWIRLKVIVFIWRDNSDCSKFSLRTHRLII